ncbi:precorrin-6A synthase (deacetylating) [Tepidimonas taiwanensis]|uniref:Siroheme synthase n=1 Tax=Tepidimonas taiwanensis TaxID=307486 RepID=A0A554XDB1_9BURK|nr:precorrin-6A synthase (deacetylating) [Tepidimonas taiwanensis]MDM7463711.1 precorrin-6A synthase (deacetylating) [Tepidimonas taiwanensis]TSE33818.1 Siroheme synthase [Tepidimonas taiwanensis]UBQ06646.1 precorrin-6A synthase (deacetylating) [Tepidimonas taiwanensis]
MRIELTLVGMGTGNPQHITQEGVQALRAADVILLPRKGEEKAALAAARLEVCRQVWPQGDGPRWAWFDMPYRHAASTTDAYRAEVQRWHDAIAQAWRDALCAALPQGGRVAMLVWGDPSIYDSTLRIAQRLAQRVPMTTRVVPGVSALQALAAAHAIALTEVSAPLLVTSARWLRENGWPEGIQTLAVMLDGEGVFQALSAPDVYIWWGAYLGMPQQLLCAGPLAAVGADIAALRRQARQQHGWIMDTYLLQRRMPNAPQE